MRFADTLIRLRAVASSRGDMAGLSLVRTQDLRELLHYFDMLQRRGTQDPALTAVVDQITWQQLADRLNARLGDQHGDR